MIPATTVEIPPPTTAFHCSADWHLSRIGEYAPEIHALILRVQGEQKDFFGSVPQIAEYFDGDIKTVRDRLHVLRDLGFVEEVEARAGNSVVYRALTHAEWALRHPGRCCVKRVKNNPSRETVGVEGRATQIAPPQNVPLPPNGSTPSHQTVGDPSRETVGKSPYQSPRESPKDTDTVTQQKDAASLAAGKEAFKTFCQEMEEDSAFDMVLWILYRAASVKSGAQVPRFVDYYRQAKDNLTSQHENDWERIIDGAEGKFCKHAYRFVESKSPDLLAWLKGKARQLAGRSAEAA